MSEMCATLEKYKVHFSYIDAYAHVCIYTLYMSISMVYICNTVQLLQLMKKSYEVVMNNFPQSFGLVT